MRSLPLLSTSLLFATLACAVDAEWSDYAARMAAEHEGDRPVAAAADRAWRRTLDFFAGRLAG
jgi:hypothetical protein